MDKALDDWVEANKDAPALGDMITRPMIQSDLGGQLMVAAHESKIIELTREHEQLWLFQAPPPNTFLNLPFTEAIDLYKRLDIPREKEFLDVLREYSNRSGEARELFLRYIRETSRTKIIEALEQGRDMRQYLADFQGFLGDLGVSAQNPHYLQTVYRTNVATAYGAGRFRQLTDPEVVEEIPYRIYKTAGDSRVRHNHAILEDMIFRADDPDFNRMYPPLSYNCRCAVIGYELQSGDTVSTEPPAAYVPEPGFNASPVAMLVEALT